MATRQKPAQAEQYTTIAIENTEAITMELFVAVPGGEEYFVASLEPGDKTVQFSPVGAVWSLKPEVAVKQFVAEAGGAQAAAAESPLPKKSTRKGRGGHAITTDLSDPNTTQKTGGSTSS